MDDVSSQNAVGRILPPADPADPKPPLTPLLLLSDGQEHATRRSIVNRAFTPLKIADWEPRVRQVAEQHVDRLRELEEVGFCWILPRCCPSGKSA